MPQDVNSLLTCSLYKKQRVAALANIPRYRFSGWMSGNLKMSESDINNLKDTLIDLNFSRKTVLDAIKTTCEYYDKEI